MHDTHGPAALSTVGNALNAAGLIVPSQLLLDVTGVSLIEADRDTRVEAIVAEWPDLARGEAAKLVDLAAEALA